MGHDSATTLDWLIGHDPLHVTPLADAVIDGLGFDPRSAYVEHFWLGVLDIGVSEKSVYNSFANSRERQELLAGRNGSGSNGSGGSSTTTGTGTTGTTGTDTATITNLQVA